MNTPELGQRPASKEIVPRRAGLLAPRVVAPAAAALSLALLAGINAPVLKQNRLQELAVNGDRNAAASTHDTAALYLADLALAEIRNDKTRESDWQPGDVSIVKRPNPKNDSVVYEFERTCDVAGAANPTVRTVITYSKSSVGKDGFVSAEASDISSVYVSIGSNEGITIEKTMLPDTRTYDNLRAATVGSPVYASYLFDNAVFAYGEKDLDRVQGAARRVDLSGYDVSPLLNRAIDVATATMDQDKACQLDASSAPFLKQN